MPKSNSWGPGDPRYDEGQRNREAIYDFIVKWLYERRYWPRSQDIAEGAKVSVTTVKNHMRALEADGRIRHAGPGDQSWVLVKPARTLLDLQRDLEPWEVSG